jgi:hypothetical protein
MSHYIAPHSREQFQLDELAISKLLHEPGEPCDFGFPLNEHEAAMTKARELSDKPCTLVSEWTLWDLDPDTIPGFLKKSIKEGHVQPVMINFNEIIYDELGRFRFQLHRHLEQLERFSHNAFFETKYNMYVLMGPGTRKVADTLFALSSH